MRFRLNELSGQTTTGARTAARLSIAAPEGFLGEPVAPENIDAGPLFQAGRGATRQRQEVIDADTAAAARLVADRVKQGDVTPEEALKELAEDGKTPRRLRSILARTNFERLSDNPVFQIAYEETEADFQVEMYRTEALATIREQVESIGHVPLGQRGGKIQELLGQYREAQAEKFAGLGFYGKARVNERLENINRELVNRGLDIFQEKMETETGQKMRMMAASYAEQWSQSEDTAREAEEMAEFNRVIEMAVQSMPLDEAVQVAGDAIMGAAANIEKDQGADEAEEFLEEFSARVRGRGPNQPSILQNTGIEDLISAEIINLRSRAQRDRTRQLQEARLEQDLAGANFQKTDVFRDAARVTSEVERQDVFDKARQEYNRAEDKEAYLESIGFEGSPQFYELALQENQSLLLQSARDNDRGDLAQFKRLALQLADSPEVKEGNLELEFAMREMLQNRPALLGAQYEGADRFIRSFLETKEAAPRVWSALSKTDQKFQYSLQFAEMMIPPGIRADSPEYSNLLQKNQLAALKIIEDSFSEILEDPPESFDDFDALQFYQGIREDIARRFNVDASRTTAEGLLNDAEEAAATAQTLNSVNDAASIYAKQGPTVFGNAVGRDEIQRASIFGRDLFDLEDTVVAPNDQNEVSIYSRLRAMRNIAKSAVDGADFSPRQLSKVAGFSYSVAGVLDSGALLQLAEGSQDGDLSDEESKAALGSLDERNRDLVLEGLEALGGFALDSTNLYATRLLDFTETTGWTIAPEDGSLDGQRTLDRTVIPTESLERIDRLLELFDQPINDDTRARFIMAQQKNWRR